MERWPAEGVPANPRAWLVSTGRFKAIDGLRRRARFDASLASVADQLGDGVTAPLEIDDDGVEDDRLRLIFTCCHPALPPDAQIALTLREVCGLTTEEIARAFLSPAPTLAQRIVRAKAKIKAGPDSLSGAGAGRSARAARHGAPRHLSGVQRGLLGVVGRLRSPGTICRPRPSGWAGSWSSCCRSPRRSGCWR